MRMSVVVQVFSRRQRRPHHALRRPAAEKRQGTKSRGVGHCLAAALWRFRHQPRTRLRSGRRPAGSVNGAVGRFKAASGREAAVRIAERFHNFCAPARMLQKNGDFIFLASVISNSCAWKNVAEIAHFTIVARLIRRAAFCGMGVDQFLASRV